MLLLGIKDGFIVLVINNGIIFQHALISGVAAGSTITYPISFSSHGHPVATLHYSATAANYGYLVHIYNTTATSFEVGNSGASAVQYFTYISMGR